MGGCFQAPTPTGASHAKPATFIVIQNAKPIFTVYAYSAEQARALVAAKVAGETIIVAVTLRPTSPVWVAFDGAAQ